MTKKENRIHPLHCICTVARTCPLAVPFRKSHQAHYVSAVRYRQSGVLCGWYHPCRGFQGQPRVLQVYLPDYGLPQADELLLLASHPLRRGQVHPLRQMLESLPNGGRSEQQFTQAEKRYRVHPVSEMQKGMSCEGFEIKSIRFCSTVRNCRINILRNHRRIHLTAQNFEDRNCYKSGRQWR